MTLPLYLFLIFGFSVSFIGFGFAQDKPSGHSTVKPNAKEQPATPSQPPPQKPPHIIREGSMTIQKMDVIIKRLDKKAKNVRQGVWSFNIEKRPVVIVTDTKQNRMRILVPIRSVEGLSIDILKRILQANFDTALDSRYAIAQNVLWGTFIHSLSTLHERQFISAIGQTVNIAVTFGTTYSSGALSYGGGDSRNIIRRQLIDKLLKKGLPI